MTIKIIIGGWVVNFFETQCRYCRYWLKFVENRRFYAPSVFDVSVGGDTIRISPRSLTSLAQWKTTVRIKTGRRAHSVDCVTFCSYECVIYWSATCDHPLHHVGLALSDDTRSSPSTKCDERIHKFNIVATLKFVELKMHGKTQRIACPA